MLTRTDHLTTALRTLDAADHRRQDSGDRARADLRRILATPPTPPSTARPPGRAPRQDRPAAPAPTARRLALAAGAVAAVTAGVVAAPSLTGGDRAFATWTADPDAMTAQQRAGAAAGCRSAQGEGAAADHADDLRAAEPAVAERRGTWTTVILAGTDGFSALCITDDSAGRFARGMLGSVGTAAGETLPTARGLVASTLGTGTMSAGDISLAAGTAGPDVVGVVYASPVHGDVAATVSQGHFALWMPGDDLEHAPTDGVEVRVTYRDGSSGTTRLTL